MDQGMQLAPSDDQRILSARSPTVSPPIPSSIIKERKNNDSQQSLFYSSSTWRQDITHRSPKCINMPILQSQKPKIRIDGQKSLKQRVTQKIGRSKKVFQQDAQNFQRKNIQKAQTQKIQQLQQALGSQTLLTQQLRSKISLMSSLIQKGLKQTELAQFLKCKISNKNLNHVDIFLQLSDIRDKLESANNHNQNITKQNIALKQKIISLQKELCKKIDITNQNQTLVQQNQTLSAYVQECQKKYNTLLQKSNIQIAQIKVLEQQNNQQILTTNATSTTNHSLQQQLSSTQQLLSQTQHQLSSIKQQFQSRIQSLKQQYVSVLLQKDQQLSDLKQTLLESQKKLNSILLITNKKQDYDRLRWELQNSRKQREYYHQQYLKKLNQSAELHQIKLKHKAEVQYLKDKIGRKGKEMRDTVMTN